MIYVQNNGFQISSRRYVCSITENSFKAESADVKDGLSIDYINKTGHAIAIAFVKPDKDGEIKVDMVGTRFFDYVEPHQYSTARMMIQAAISLVEAANYKEE